jgi:hypothetical protein
MATFLELCQKVARESGTISGTAPASVIGQTDRLSKVVHWTRDAWTAIQNARGSWLWMRREFSGTTSAGIARYTPAAFSLGDHGRWLTDQPLADYFPMSAYLQSAGANDEGLIQEIPFNLWRTRYDRGIQVNARPSSYAVSPLDDLCLGPVPDGTYVIKGEYVKTPQILSANGDIPEMPARFHDAIVWKAVLLLAEHDEANVPMATARANYAELMVALERDQLPRLTIASQCLA